MACIKINEPTITILKEYRAEELDRNDPTQCWKNRDVGGNLRNVLYYAWDVKKVISQADGKASYPVFLKIKAGPNPPVISFCLRKNEPDGNHDNPNNYYPYGTGGWPPLYEQTDEDYAPGNTIYYDPNDEVVVYEQS